MLKLAAIVLFILGGCLFLPFLQWVLHTIHKNTKVKVSLVTLYSLSTSHYVFSCNATIHPSLLPKGESDHMSSGHKLSTSIDAGTEKRKKKWNHPGMGPKSMWLKGNGETPHCPTQFWNLAESASLYLFHRGHQGMKTLSVVGPN